MSRKLDETLAYNPFDFVEPCEPNCTPERHAYHQGGWDMAVRICRHFGVFPNPVDGDTIPEQAKAQIKELMLEDRQVFAQTILNEIEILKDTAVVTKPPKRYYIDSHSLIKVIKHEAKLSRTD